MWRVHSVGSVEGAIRLIAPLPVEEQGDEAVEAGGRFT